MVDMPQGLILSLQVRGLHKASLTLSPPGRAERNPSCKSLPSLGSPGPESVESGVWGTAVEHILGPSAHRAEGTRQGSRPGCPAETTPPQRHTGTGPQHPLLSQSPDSLLTARDILERSSERHSGLRPAWLTNHPHTGQGFLIPQGSQPVHQVPPHFSHYFRDMASSA